MKKKLSKVLVLMIVVAFALTGCFGNGGADIGGDKNNNDLNGEWSVYNNDVLSMDYLNQWHYIEESNEDGQAVMFSSEETDFDKEFIIDKDFITMTVNILNYEYILEEYYEISEHEVDNAKELIEELEIVMEERMSENTEETDSFVIESITLDGQYGFVIKTLFESIFLEEIYYDLNLIKDDITEINDIMINYNNEQDFVDNVTIEELENIKEILENDEEDYINVINDINFYLEQGTTEVFFETKIIFTYYNNEIIYINSRSLQETFNNNREIIERMIDSIEFK